MSNAAYKNPVEEHRKMHEEAARQKREFYEQQAQPQSFPKHYTIQQAADFIGKSNEYVRKKMRQGELRTFQFGGTGMQFVLHDDLLGLIKFVGE